MSTETQTAKPPKPEKIPIYIDGTKYQAHANELTGTAGPGARPASGRRGSRLVAGRR